MTVKQRMKRNRWVYAGVHAYRRWIQNAEIQKEQMEYERLAVENQIPLQEDLPGEVFRRVREKLKSRNVMWPPQAEGRPIHILYCSLPGNWERHNIPPELNKIGRTTSFFLEEQGIPWQSRDWRRIREAVDQRLPKFVEALHRQQPVDLMLSYLSGSQISPATIQTIKAMGIPAFSFHMDDRLFFRGKKFGHQWSGPAAVCAAYDLNLTNAAASLVKYRVEGAEALFWPPGANPDYFQPLNLPLKYDVSFCGQMYGKRPLLIQYLRSQGLKVDCFGSDWEHGYQQDEDLVKIFSQSRINLGLGYVGWTDDQCVKGRDFEIPSCGALYLTSHNENLDRIYRVGEEIETYQDFRDCADKIKFLLAHPEHCERMRQAARQAVVHRHSWSKRVRQLLACETDSMSPA